MLSYKLKRTYIYRIICMIMLVLIQFDAYGYEIVGSFGEDIKPVSFALSASDVLADGDQENAEWSDPVYRAGSSVPRALIKITLSFLCFLPLVVVCLKTIGLRRAVTAPVAREASCARLLYCMLII